MMVQIGSRHREDLAELLRNITGAEVVHCNSGKLKGVCSYMGGGACSPGERAYVQVRLRMPLREQKYFFHATCYKLFMATLLN